MSSKVRNNDIIINGYIQTSDGVVLDYKIIEEQNKLRKRKYTDKQVKDIKLFCENINLI